MLRKGRYFNQKDTIHGVKLTSAFLVISFWIKSVPNTYRVSRYNVRSFIYLKMIYKKLDVNIISYYYFLYIYEWEI